MTTENTPFLAVFPTALGWMTLSGRERTVERLSFGFASQAAALRALPSTAPQSRPPVARPEESSPWIRKLVRRLQAYAEGAHDEFHDIPVSTDGLSDFQRRVVAQCRRIPWGRTMTYGQLAAAVGSPRAARAVGNCMAQNPIPLLIPCHRVVGSDGSLHGYSAAGGQATKARLLRLEKSRVNQSPTQ